MTSNEQILIQEGEKQTKNTTPTIKDEIYNFNTIPGKGLSDETKLKLCNKNRKYQEIFDIIDNTSSNPKKETEQKRSGRGPLKKNQETTRKSSKNVKFKNPKLSKMLIDLNSLITTDTKSTFRNYVTSKYKAPKIKNKRPNIQPIEALSETALTQTIQKESSTKKYRRLLFPLKMWIDNEKFSQADSFFQMRRKGLNQLAGATNNLELTGLTHKRFGTANSAKNILKTKDGFEFNVGKKENNSKLSGKYQNELSFITKQLCLNENPKKRKRISTFTSFKTTPKKWI